MIATENLKDLLSKREYSRLDKLMLCLAAESARAKSISEVRALAVGAGLTEAKKWNIADTLGRAKGNVIRSKEGWELTSDGREAAGKLAGSVGTTVVPRVAAGLRHHLNSISDQQTRDFLDEAVRCFEGGQYRAAVVLSWVGAVAMLQDHVLANELSAFNAEASRRDPKWKAAKTRDDLARLKEADFLNILESISVVGKSVKQELEACLKLRNGSGHPNSLKLGEAKVAAHIETLIQNVFSVF